MFAVSVLMCCRRRTSELCSSNSLDIMQSSVLSAAGLVGPCLEKIIEATPARRKEFVNLRHDAKACHACSEPVLNVDTEEALLKKKCIRRGVLRFSLTQPCQGMQCLLWDPCLLVVFQRQSACRR